MNSLRVKMFAVALIPALLLVLTVLCYVLPSVGALTHDLTEKNLLTKLKGDLQAARLYMDRYFGELSLENGQLVDKDMTPIGGRMWTVDAISNNLENTATIYVARGEDFARVLTGVRQEDGSRAEGTFLGADSAAYPSVAAGKQYFGEAEILGTAYYTAYDPLVDCNGAVIGLLSVGVPKAEAERMTTDQLNTITRALIAVMVIVTAFAVIFVIYIGGGVTRPLKVMQDRLEDLATQGGDLTQRLEIKGGGEVGAMAEAVNKMLESIREIVEKTVDLAAGVNRGSEAVSAASEEMSASLEEVSASSNEFAGNAQSLSISSQKMAETNARIVGRAEEGEKMITGAVGHMMIINNRVGELQEVITAVVKRSSDIGRILGIISDIADQTNLLALNAAIEAARAGEQGRGFAVVAEEVRKLAEQSARAATEIGELIKATQYESRKALESMDLGVRDVETGTAVVAKTGTAFTEILGDVSEIARHVEETASASQELSAGSEEMAASVEEQSSTMQEVAATAEELRSAAEQLYHELQKFKYQ
ncbi:MAG: methyl-accepting chemotaxis protein [Bacillota bacterium]